MLADADVERVLVVTAHPDDVDFGAAGTIAQWTAKGIEVHYCILTNGDQGGFDDTPRHEMGPMRQREQRAAGDVLGVSSIEFLGHPDGHLMPSVELRGEVVRAIRRVRPQRMIIISPDRNWSRIQASHPDHMASGEIAIQAVYPDARNEFAFPGLLEQGYRPWTVEEVWVMWAPHLNHYVDITSTIDAKLAALKAHVSQTSHNPDFEKFVRERSAMLAEQAGLPAGSYAEAFMVVQTA
jgi:LmbE family N-acetylglucosaminyl deacetylase